MRPSRDGAMTRRIVIVAAVGFLLRVAVTLTLPARPFSDFQMYFAMAESLADSGSLRWVLPMHPPGYPAVLAPVFLLTPGIDRLLVTKLINCLLGLATVLLGAGLARRLWGENAALVAATVFAFAPRQLLMPSLVASENLFTPLLFVFVGLALTRTVAYFAGVVWLAAALAGGRKWRDLAREFALVLLVQHAVMLPWALSNLKHHGRFSFLTCSSGIGLFIGNNDNATGLWYPEWM